MKNSNNVVPKKSSYQNSISRSDLNPYKNGNTTSANINRSNNPIIGNTGGATGIGHLNSNINECTFF